MKKIIMSICLLGLLVGLVTTVAADRPKPAEKLAVEGPSNANVPHSGPATKRIDNPRQTKAPKALVAGTIQYDDGVFSSGPSVGSQCYGNRFDTAGGSPLLASGSVTQVQFYMSVVSGTAAFVSFLGGIGGGTPVTVYESATHPAITGTWNTDNVGPINYTGASFLAGIWYGGGDAGALGGGTNAGQGIHGMFINDIAGTGYVALDSTNALLRVTGDVLLPVELMSMSIE